MYRFDPDRPRHAKPRTKCVACLIGGIQIDDLLTSCGAHPLKLCIATAYRRFGNQNQTTTTCHSVAMYSVVWLDTDYLERRR